ncbi:hypothetical protein HYV43_06535 [Candidatus Micrarchaeota archaeon]|nr:hypothetical protein [Candidatus Micrarchaeota archaeon]
MVNTTTDYLILTGFIVFFIAIIAYGIMQKNQRQNQIKQFKKSPDLQIGKPVLVHGMAGGTAYALPSTGEKVAYYSMSVVSSQITETQVLYNSSMEGFGAFAQTGDLDITDAGKTYRVSIQSAFDNFAIGTDLMKTTVNTMAAGVNRTFLDNAVELKTKQSVLMVVFGFFNPYSDAGSKTQVRMPLYSRKTAKMDSQPLLGQKGPKSNVSTRTSRYTVGRDVPQSVQDLLKAKGILGNLSKEGQEILLVENYIPYGQDVYVFGKLGENNEIVYGGDITQLSVSYQDPETI